MLAMEVNDNAASLTPRGALGFIASMLAPTEDSGPHAIDNDSGHRQGSCSTQRVPHCMSRVSALR
ncbi:hypothetical protein PSUM_04230 [Pseudomonas umsongensis]|uniref:Uncharacterized protein n=1 Tax=Pseudomonas umsongensis TaxID=198618 RepID=A0ABX4E4N7_9PSED|nr:hypothetical protein PSUM_04230 [Pseudomonas umsongensis]SDT22617.1 hypothetical protein SAMN04490206_2403 [Pseudomonas umsongensis]